MNSQILGLRVSGTIFGLVALAQLVRLVAQLGISIAGFQVPLWLSVIGFVLAGALSYWMWRLSLITVK